MISTKYEHIYIFINCVYKDELGDKQLSMSKRNILSHFLSLKASPRLIKGAVKNIPITK